MSVESNKGLDVMWSPSATRNTLEQRAAILQRIRRFFEQRKVLEVETPSLSHHATTDVYLNSFKSHFLGPNFSKGCPTYLMTSPEFHMKRLLAAGSGCIYQLSKAFRNEEYGRYHNPEFLMLEWYRVGYDHYQLMDEMECFLRDILDISHCERWSYSDIFQKLLQFCPLSISDEGLNNELIRLGYKDWLNLELSRDDKLQWLFSEAIEPQIGLQQPCMVYDFPRSQAALARISEMDPRCAHRFEVYFRGVELANGFNELTDADEQALRFQVDLALRQHKGLPCPPHDPHLLAALKQGLPACSGVALGVDRLIMLALNHTSIQSVLAFEFQRA